MFFLCLVSLDLRGLHTTGTLDGCVVLWWVVHWWGLVNKSSVVSLPTSKSSTIATYACPSTISLPQVPHIFLLLAKSLLTSISFHITLKLADAVVPTVNPRSVQSNANRHYKLLPRLLRSTLLPQNRCSKLLHNCLHLTLFVFQKIDGCTGLALDSPMTLLVYCPT